MFGHFVGLLGFRHKQLQNLTPAVPAESGGTEQLGYGPEISRHLDVLVHQLSRYNGVVLVGYNTRAALSNKFFL
jgi:hypothetical protein